jgi:hypothetical protein
MDDPKFAAHVLLVLRTEAMGGYRCLAPNFCYPDDFL